MHWINVYRSSPSTTDDPEERAYRLEHWEESTKANWRILRLQWARLFAWRLTKEERWRQEGTRMFAIMHHPMAGTRQLADWYRAGPQNPPPAVKRAISSLRSPAVTEVRLRAAARLKERRNEA